MKCLPGRSEPRGGIVVSMAWWLLILHPEGMDRGGTMQNLRLPYTLTVLFCAAALCGAGCHRANNSGHDSLADAVREAAAPVPKSATAHPATPSALPPQGNELRPEARSVAVGSAPPADTAGAASPGDPQQELETWERQLAERQAALDARERKLAERERMAPGNRPAPAPAPAAPLASAPAAVAAGGGDRRRLGRRGRHPRAQHPSGQPRDFDRRAARRGSGLRGGGQRPGARRRDPARHGSAGEAPPGGADLGQQGREHRT